MSFRDTLARILLRLQGLPFPDPPQVLTDAAPGPHDSKETLALKWERNLMDVYEPPPNPTPPTPPPPPPPIIPD